MDQGKDLPNFDRSEPEFLISYLDRHVDWAVIVCLVGGGQEIHTGEAGIAEWIEAIRLRFPGWRVHVSPNLTDSEYAAQLSRSEGGRPEWSEFAAEFLNDDKYFKRRETWSIYAS